jgi:endo-1,4-beta-xylanase
MQLNTPLLNRLGALALAMAMVSSACSSDDGGGGGSGGSGVQPAGEPTFAAIYSEIIIKGAVGNCTFGACHGQPPNANSGMLELFSNDKDMTYARLVGPASTSAACGGMPMVTPGNPDMSLLYLKLLATPPCGVRMPFGGMLTDGQIEQIRLWIANGAQNNGMVTAGTGGAAGMMGGVGGMTGGVGGMTGGVGGMTGGMGGASDGGMVDEPPKRFVGNITTGGRVRTDFIEYWDQITPENEGKWGSVERDRDDMDWSGLDAAYAYANEHDIPFKQHTFVWGSQQPGWITGLSQAEQRAEVEEWIRLYCERYPNTQLIDVVNEPPPHTTPSYAAALGGAGASGYDWIVQSFEWARQYCPNAILILNDYNTIEYGDQNANFIDIVNRIRDAGAPIDAIGAQAHAAFDLPTSTVKMYLDRLAATGLPVYISEYDINLASDEQQRQVMQEQMTMFWDHEAVPGITLWGYIEGQTWLANTGLMTSGGEQRPAMIWLMDFLGR